MTTPTHNTFSQLSSAKQAELLQHLEKESVRQYRDLFHQEEEEEAEAELEEDLNILL